MSRSRRPPTLSDQDAAQLADIRQRTETALRAVIPPGADVAILDAPNQLNVGDSLIWLGELAYLKRLGHRIRYVADRKTYDAAALRRALPPGGVVLLHGGGNLGDLWLGHQLFRERVVQELADYRLVQLPQSIYFKDADRARLADEVLGGHPDLHVLVRDPLSVARMAEQLPSVRFSHCPDMALGWDPPRRRRIPITTDVLVLARADKEASSGLAEAAATWSSVGRVRLTDWKSEGVWSAAWKLCRATTRGFDLYGRARRRVPILPAGLVDRWFGHVITMMGRVNFYGAERLYRPSSHIVVDRLHAHVLAVLMDKHHSVLDNNYRKVSSIFDDYSGAFSTAQFFDSPDAVHDDLVRRRTT